MWEMLKLHNNFLKQHKNTSYAKLTFGQKFGGQKFSADKTFGGQKFSADKIFGGQKFSADKIDGTKSKFRQFCPPKMFVRQTFFFNFTWS